MDIRTKFVFVLVAVALGSMLFLGLSMYINAEEALRESRLERLDGLAESKQDGLDEVFAGWIDRVSLVASRTQLRLSLREHNLRSSAEASARIDRILNDAVDAVDVIKSLAVFERPWRGSTLPPGERRWPGISSTRASPPEGTGRSGSGSFRPSGWTGSPWAPSM